MRKFEQGNLEPFAEGLEKKVYNHPEDESKLIAFLKDKKEPGLLKGQFYLTKVAHMLLPDNIPDIHFAGGDTNPILVVEKKQFDDEHDEVRKNALNFFRRGGFSIGEERKQSLEQIERIKNDNKYGVLNSQLLSLGFEFDNAEVNYGIDDQGNMVYYDSLMPWKIIEYSDVTVLEKSFDKDKLEGAIKNLPTEQQATASSY